MKRLSLLAIASATTLVSTTIAPAQAPIPTPAQAVVTAADPVLTDAITSGDFKPWRKKLAARIKAASLKTGFSATEVQALDLDLARHEFLLQTMPSTGLPAATRPTLTGKAAAETSAVDALKVVSSTPEGKKFLSWLLNDGPALENYLESTFFSIAETDRTYGLNLWAKIWEKYPESRTGLWCRVAAAFAVTYGKERSTTETAWDQKIVRVQDPMDRYEFYRTSRQAGKLVPYFSNAPAWELVYTVHGSFRSIEEMQWAQQMLPPDRFNQRGAAGMAYQIVRYRLNNYRSSSIHGSGYFDGKPNTLMTVADYGSVCGGISNAGTSVATAFGVPSFTIGQPGHCAYVSKGSPTSWDGGNFVSGWKDSFDAHQIKFFGCNHSVNVKLLTRAYNHPKFAESEQLRRLANLQIENGDKPGALASLDKAATLCPVHFLARHEAVNLLMESDTQAMVTRLARECVSLTRDMAEFPMMTETIRREAEEKRLNVSLTPDLRAAYLGQIGTALASVPTAKQANLGTKAFVSTLTRQLATFGLKEKQSTAVIDFVVSPKKVKAGETPPAAPTLTPPAKPAELVRYLNALTAAANSREAHAQAITAIIHALPDDVRTGITLKPDPKIEPQPPKYDAKTFVKIGAWSRDTVTSSVEVTDGWRELQVPLPPAMRHPGQLAVAFVQSNGDTITIENLRLFADGTEVETDDRSIQLKGKNKNGIFIVQLDPSTTKAKLSIKVVVSELAAGQVSDGEIRILEPAPQTVQR